MTYRKRVSKVRRQKELIENTKGNRVETPKKQELPYSKKVLDQIRTNVGRLPAETGGLLGTTIVSGEEDLYYFDSVSKNSSVTFYYDVESMSEKYREWKGQGYITNGIVHSHPTGAIRPSYHDVSTAYTHMKFFDLPYFLMPIVQSSRKGYFTMYCYRAELVGENVELYLEKVITATREGYEYPLFAAWHTSYEVKALDAYKGRVEKPEKTESKRNTNDESSKINTKDLFVKVDNLIPEKVRKKKVICCFGGGGSRHYLISLARHGFENFIIWDHDRVSSSNIATQEVYCGEIGKSKVLAIRDDIMRVNPKAKVICVDKFLDDDITDEEVKKYMDMFKVEKSTDYLILGCTDSFDAQERSAALSLKYGTAYLAAMMYKGGAAAEIIFTYPGITASCPRCLLRKRYEWYENGYQNDVTSAECSYFATDVMNAYKGYISLMLLCYKEKGVQEFADMLDAVKDRNFVEIRLSPKVKDVLGITLFDKVFGEESRYTFLGEPIWVPQTPDDAPNDKCKLCGGVGNLKQLKTKWKYTDTRRLCVCSKRKAKEAVLRRNSYEYAKNTDPRKNHFDISV